LLALEPGIRLPPVDPDLDWAQSPGFWVEQLVPDGQAEQAFPLVYTCVETKS
jgi:hypothetical protein